ncbi:MAG TPA: malectin domain-containing carbohydrate-binding protein [Balneolales bacterium]|nr:malectin domain-containing carbohydrate-binding protein [Balneolales bacterium]
MSIKLGGKIIMIKKVFHIKYRAIIFSIFLVFFANYCNAQTEIIKVPDSGWRLWPDTAAKWRNDKIFLPGTFDLKKLPVNPPDGGWNVLNTSNGISVTLPATVEEYYWGKFGLRPYKNAYYFEKKDHEVENGNYKGVSWWWKWIKIPKNFKGKKVILHLRGERLRAEIYINRKLTGYNIINGVSYDCDISKEIIPGKKNLLAIRITNPGGELDWVDTRLMKWGGHTFQRSHGFGGLDRGITITAHDPVYISDLWIANTPKINKIIAHTAISNSTNRKEAGVVRYDLFEKKKPDKILQILKKSFSVNAGEKLKIKQDISYSNAKIWSLKHPELYDLKVTVQSGKHWTDNKQSEFGFRWFNADGINSNAVFNLNHKRIRLVSAISWGFWGYNGLFPTPKLARKEVMDARKLGLNCLQFHRNAGREQVFDAMDNLGLLRYMEPGGGQDALGTKYSLYAKSPTGKIDDSGKNGKADTFTEKYTQDKIMRMIHDFRGHPSLIMYTIQNEINPDLRNPRIFNLIRKMHKADPSRIIVLKSGIPPRNQVWMQPYDTTVYYDHGNGYSGWHDQHTVGGPGVWQDNMYKNPKDFTHRSTNKKEIVIWGEMLGSGTPDIHGKMIKEIKAHGGHSYDLSDHEQIYNAYDKFLNKWDFKSAFKTPDDLFRDIGNKSYDFWGRVIETAKLSDENDYFVISGWESTAIEDHSGLIDNLRDFKGDPSYISRRLKSLRPVMEPRSLVVARGKKAIIDLFLINETNKPEGKKLDFYMKDPNGDRKQIGTFTIPEYHNNKFSYRVADSVLTPSLTHTGKYQISLQMDSNPDVISYDTLLVLDPIGPLRSIPKKIGVYCENPDFEHSLSRLLPGADIENYKKGERYDLLIASSKLKYGWQSVVSDTVQIKKTLDDELYRTESWGYDKNLEYNFTNLPKGKARVTLKFAEITLNGPKQRIMSVAINGDTIINNLDIFKKAGGKDIALDSTFVVKDPSGSIHITIPKLTVNYAKFSAIKVVAGDSVIAINCGAKKPYVDHNGQIWRVYSSPSKLNSQIIKQVKNGMSLLALPIGQEASLAYARLLAKAGAYKCFGHVGEARAPWMGSWDFVRKFPVMDGLPVNQAMKSYYQVPVNNADGIILDGKNVHVFIGYGRGHDRRIGASGFTSKLGKGKILFYTIPGIISGVDGHQTGMQPVYAKRLMTNSIRYLNN